MVKTVNVEKGACVRELLMRLRNVGGNAYVERNARALKNANVYKTQAPQKKN